MVDLHTHLCHFVILVAYALVDVPGVTTFLVRAIAQIAARTGTTMYGPFKTENIVGFNGRTSPVASVTI
ncbi:hypothetical protein ASG82_22810 [Mycobacterium sp. Soil538]|nr:hypothetical protein ASG82_22810 [Mycobacterium sp. Soil538]